MIYLYRKAVVRTTLMTKPWWNLMMPSLQFSKLSCKPKRTKTRKKVKFCTHVLFLCTFTTQKTSAPMCGCRKLLLFSSNVLWIDAITWIILQTTQHHVIVDKTCLGMFFCCTPIEPLYLIRVRSFGVIWIRISDPRSLGSWCIKGTDESTLVTDSSVPLMHHDPSDRGSLILIQITPKERTLNLLYFPSYSIFNRWHEDRSSIQVKVHIWS